MTPAEQQVLHFIRDRLESSGIAPTIQEITDHMGAASKSSAARAVDSLIEQGLLIRKRSKSRGLFLPDLPNLDAVPTRALQAALLRRGEALPDPSIRGKVASLAVIDEYEGLPS